MLAFGLSVATKAEGGLVQEQSTGTGMQSRGLNEGRGGEAAAAIAATRYSLIIPVYAARRWTLCWPNCPGSPRHWKTGWKWCSSSMVRPRSQLSDPA